MFCSCDLLEIFLELASFSVGSAAMLSKSQRQDAPEALQDVRMYLLWDQELPSEENLHQHILFVLLDEAGSEYELVGKRAPFAGFGFLERIFEPKNLELAILEKFWVC